MDDWEVASLTYQVHSTTTTTTNTNLENKSSTSATNSNSNNNSGENVIVKDASAPTPIHNSHEDVIDDGDGIATEGEEEGGGGGEPKKLKSINDYYNTNNIGFYQTLSLVLNAGLMIYAQGRCICYVSSMHNIYNILLTITSLSLTHLPQKLVSRVLFFHLLIQTLQLFLHRLLLMQIIIITMAQQQIFAANKTIQYGKTTVENQHWHLKLIIVHVHLITDVLPTQLVLNFVSKVCMAIHPIVPYALDQSYHVGLVLVVRSFA